MSVRSKSYKKSKLIETEKMFIKNKPPTSMSEITDVDVSAANNQDLLKYESSLAKWTSFTNPLIQNSVAIGSNAGIVEQGDYSVAIGRDAGSNRQGDYSVSIGYEANKDGGLYVNNIVINASNGYLNAEADNRTYINPIRTDDTSFSPTTITPMLYNTSTKELVTSKFHSGYLKILPINSGNVSADDCCGRVLYSTTAGGTINFPPALEGMNIFHISGMNPQGSITLQADGSDLFYDSSATGSSTHVVDNNGSHALIHWIICAENGKWFLID